MAWFIYDLELDELDNRFHLKRLKTVYTQFHTALNRITIAEPGDLNKFIDHLQEKLDKNLTTDMHQMRLHCSTYQMARKCKANIRICFFYREGRRKHCVIILIMLSVDKFQANANLDQ
jgi:hypothetical protein